MNKSVVEKLLYPITIDEFYQDYWDQKILFIKRNDSAYYEDVLTLEQINDFLSRTDISYPMVRLAKESEKIPPESYTILSDKNEDILVDTEKIIAHFYEGATVGMQFMKYAISSLANFTRGAENIFKGTVQTNAYLTPRESKGFELHYDAHNLFVMQVHGTKEWNIYGALADLPTIDQTSIGRDFGNITPEMRLKLEPGDLLYIPRGFGHEASTTDEVSLHITTSIFPALWIDVFREALETSPFTEELNKSILPIASPEEKQHHFARLNKNVVENMNLDEILNRLWNNGTSETNH